ncbi:response regulator transcription factor [Neobacillus mesonae]|uniref:hypothetical protein n=1 Tax=Neobacillus mesonae TaxID=1193713 RepID=UPI001F3E83D3|nr:hypothetical protein [Neobacillus mesonae]
MEPRLLLVEDEPGMLEEMQTYLQRKGFRVLTACTGKEALIIARSERPEKCPLFKNRKTLLKEHFFVKN